MVDEVQELVKLLKDTKIPFEMYPPSSFEAVSSSLDYPSKKQCKYHISSGDEYSIGKLLCVSTGDNKDMGDHTVKETFEMISSDWDIRRSQVDHTKGIDNLIKRKQKELASTEGISVFNSKWEKYALLLSKLNGLKETTDYLNENFEDYWWYVKYGTDLKEPMLKVREKAELSLKQLLGILATLDTPVKE